MSESYLALGGIIIDDLVYEDGTTSMGVLGGGGLYAALGSRIWSEDVYMVARVGRDFNVTSVSEKGLRTEYIELTSLPTPRAWQLLDSNDERTQIPRVSAEDWYSQLVVEQHDLPDISNLTGLHILGRGSEAESLSFVFLHNHQLQFDKSKFLKIQPLHSHFFHPNRLLYLPQHNSLLVHDLIQSF